MTAKLQSPTPVDEVVLTAVVPTGKNEPEAGDEVRVPHVPLVPVLGKVTKAP